MAYLPPQKLGRVDNKCRTPHGGEPLGVVIEDCASDTHNKPNIVKPSQSDIIVINLQHVSSGPQHVKSLIHNLEPLSDLVDSGVSSNIINEFHTHLGRPPG